MQIQSQISKLGLTRFSPNIIFLSLVASGAFVLGWVGWLTWNDITEWSKDVGTIFFGSRTGEGISLGIGMALIHYFVIGASLLVLGLFMFLRNHIRAVQPLHAMMLQPQKTHFKKRKESPLVKSPMAEKNTTEQTGEDVSGCLHHFGYLSSRPKDSPIPQECIICQRLGGCMVATVYINRIE
jgi:hypothetical protein